jgi:hypothetical protein
VRSFSLPASPSRDGFVSNPGQSLRGVALT